jgi:hypothetical protein
MRDRVRIPAAEAPAASREVQLGVLGEVVHALAIALSARQAEAARPTHPTDDKPLLDVEETAELLGVSWMTVARMADEGAAPVGGPPPGAGTEDSPDPAKPSGTGWWQTRPRALSWTWRNTPPPGSPTRPGYPSSPQSITAKCLKNVQNEPTDRWRHPRDTASRGVYFFDSLPSPAVGAVS